MHAACILSHPAHHKSVCVNFLTLQLLLHYYRAPTNLPRKTLDTPVTFAGEYAASRSKQLIFDFDSCSVQLFSGDVKKNTDSTF